MRVFITGATGLLGARLLERLRADGRPITAVSRNVHPPQAGVEWIVGDLTRPGGWQDRLLGADAIVHLAGEPIDARRWSRAQKERLRKSRIDSTRLIIDGIHRARPPAVLISASGANYYGARGDEPLPEEAPPGQGFLAELCQQWETETQRAATLGVRTVSLRFGVMFGAGGGALARMVPAFKWFVGGPLGRPERWFPWIHVEDAAGLVLHALGNPLSGPVNAVAPGLVTMRELADTIGSVLHRPARIRVPEWALRLVLGELGGSINAGLKVLPRAAVASNYRFLYESLDGALLAALRAPRALV